MPDAVCMFMLIIVIVSIYVLSFNFIELKAFWTNDTGAVGVARRVFHIQRAAPARLNKLQRMRNINNRPS